MKTFQCSCGHKVFFENDFCLGCRKRLVYDPQKQQILTLETIDLERNKGVVKNGRAIRLCRNDTEFSVCNWLVNRPDDPYCLSCSLNHMIPNLYLPARREWWASMEQAKRKLLYTLLALKLPVVNKALDPDGGLAFEFIEDRSSNPEVELDVVFTGHKEGLITVNIAEADHVKREQVRQSLGESYRTLLGHFRHESGHYYYWKLVSTETTLTAFRELFGDPATDYRQAMDNYYGKRDTMARDPAYISHYAQSHPLEDWAECWAHYLHMIDTLETAAAFEINPEPFKLTSVDDMLARWNKLTVMLNALNRSMGMADAYPFVLSELSLRKIRFVHSLVNPS